MNEELFQKIEYVAEHFAIKGKMYDCGRYGNGHINSTFLLKYGESEKKQQYILQRINHHAFKNIEGLMNNIYQVTSFLRKQIIENHGDPDRETLSLILTKDGKLFFTDDDGEYWRIYKFIERATCYEQVQKPEDFYQSGKAFGHFQYLLSAFPTEKLCDTIPDFHNTPKRYKDFIAAVKSNPLGRAEMVENEIRFFAERKEHLGYAMDMYHQGKIPLRVTHNDTKLNNILIDDGTGQAICIIDLDTVMPGFSFFDFGDSIRFGANTSMEDEVDMSKAGLSLSLFEVYTKGFIDGCSKQLTENEVDMLPYGAKIMTLETGIRFLTDYLLGDQYFHIDRENHNLDRARTQIALVRDMENKWIKMKNIVEKYK